MSDDPMVDRMIAIFEKHRECFGLCDHQFPEDKFQEQQCAFEDAFCALICEHKGHEIGPDQCGIPAHDFCYRCHVLKSEIKS